MSPRKIPLAYVGGPVDDEDMASAIENGFPVLTSPDDRYTTTASPASEAQDVTIPGTEGQRYVLTDVLVSCNKLARIFIEFTDIGKAFTYKPVDVRVFEKVGYAIIPNFLSLAAGSHVRITIYNDDSATLDATVALIGILV